MTRALGQLFGFLLRIVGTVDLIAVARFSPVKEGARKRGVDTRYESIYFSLVEENGEGSRRFSRTGSHPLAPVGGSTQLDIVLDRVYKRQYVQ